MLTTLSSKRNLVAVSADFSMFSKSFHPVKQYTQRVPEDSTNQGLGFVVFGSRVSLRVLVGVQYEGQTAVRLLDVLRTARSLHLQGQGQYISVSRQAKSGTQRIVFVSVYGWAFKLCL